MSTTAGIYSVVFKTQLGEGAGIVVLENGVVRGGDSTMYYIGTYNEQDGVFSAHIKIDKHSNIAGFYSVLGTTKADLVLSGKFFDDQIQVSGVSPDAPGVSFNAYLKRIIV